MAVVLTALFTAAVVLLVTYVLLSISNLRHWQRLRVPFENPDLIFGNYREVALGRKTEEEVLGEIYDKWKGHRYVGIYQGHSPALLVRDPLLVKDLVTKAFEAFPTRTLHDCMPSHGGGYNGAITKANKGSSDMLHQNVFNAEGQVWRELRGRLTPAFTPGRVRRTAGQLRRHTKALVAAVGEAARNAGEVHLKRPLLSFAVDSVASALFGLEVGAQADPRSEFLSAAEALEGDPGSVLAVAAEAAGARRGPWGLWRRLGAVWAGAEAARARLRALFVGVAREVLAAPRSGSGCEARDFLHLLADSRMEEVDNSEGACERRVGVHVCALLLAGAHKPSALAACALAELAKAPRLQGRLRAEVEAAAEEEEEQADGARADALEKAPLLDAVISETLRLYPLEPVLTRVNRLPYTLPGTSLQLPEGTRVLLPVAAIQRDGAFYPTPSSFRPQRFISPASELYADVEADFHDDNPSEEDGDGEREGDESKGDGEALYLPFGAGPRKCIGYRLGLLQTKVAVAALLRNFHLAPGGGKSPAEAPVLRVTSKA